jgi:hypothetical protein
MSPANEAKPHSQTKDPWHFIYKSRAKGYFSCKLFCVGAIYALFNTFNTNAFNFIIILLQTADTTNLDQQRQSYHHFQIQISQHPITLKDKPLLGNSSIPETLIITRGTEFDYQHQTFNICFPSMNKNNIFQRNQCIIIFIRNKASCIPNLWFLVVFFCSKFIYFIFNL